MGKEREIERFFTTECKRKGWLAVKLASPGMAGLPDRMVLQPGGGVFFAELKAPGKRPRPLQAAMHNILRGMGFRVYVIDSREQAREAVAHEVHTA